MFCVNSITLIKRIVFINFFILFFGCCWPFQFFAAAAAAEAVVAAAAAVCWCFTLFAGCRDSNPRFCDRRIVDVPALMSFTFRTRSTSTVHCQHFSTKWYSMFREQISFWNNDCTVHTFSFNFNLFSLCLFLFAVFFSLFTVHQRWALKKLRKRLTLSPHSAGI